MQPFNIISRSQRFLRSSSKTVVLPGTAKQSHYASRLSNCTPNSLLDDNRVSSTARNSSLPAPNRDRLFIKPNDTRPQRISRIVLIGVHAQIGREQKDSARHDQGQGPAKAGHTRLAVRYATTTENGVITGHLAHSQFGS